MVFVKIEDGIVVQTQPYTEEGFIEAPDNVVCGYVYDDGEFTAPEPDAQSVILRQIRTLESSITIRRTRESILGIDNGWMASVEAQIEELREQL